MSAHCVNYRKLVSPNLDQLLPEAQFRMLAASMHFPRGLASQVGLQPHGPGTYHVLWGTDTIRVLVLREMPEADQNLVWNLFSGDPQHITAAFRRVQSQRTSWSSLLNDLLAHYGLEELKMPYTMEDYERDVKERILSKLTPKERLEGLPPKARLEGLPPKARLEGLSPEQILSLFSEEEIEAYLKKRQAEQDRPEAT